MGWCFAIVNGKLAELFFEKENGVIKMLGHAYVKESEHRTKREKLWIKRDTARYKFSYRKSKYKDLLRNKIIESIDLEKN